jgi:hypothetical protein
MIGSVNSNGQPLSPEEVSLIIESVVKEAIQSSTPADILVATILQNFQD